MPKERFSGEHSQVFASGAVAARASWTTDPLYAHVAIVSTVLEYIEISMELQNMIQNGVVVICTLLEIVGLLYLVGKCDSPSLKKCHANFFSMTPEDCSEVYSLFNECKHPPNTVKMRKYKKNFLESCAIMQKDPEDRAARFHFFKTMLLK